ASPQPRRPDRPPAGAEGRTVPRAPRRDGIGADPTGRPLRDHRARPADAPHAGRRLTAQPSDAATTLPPSRAIASRRAPSAAETIIMSPDASMSAALSKNPDLPIDASASFSDL